ncbi:GNAT family N-acetyltransferase [Chitinimonas sp.]|uniref:GNAT family N-acetyltransferase n=1 Tax=Chitinimonas sp. TaxID=1934313 RepID=UPI0035B1C3B8
MSYQLRPPQSDEIDTIANWAIAAGWPGRDKYAALTVAEFGVLLTQPGHYSFAMSEAGRPALGFGQLWVHADDTVSLLRIIVAPHLRGQGLGKQLTALLLEEARKLAKARQIKLKVLRDNLAAVAVYTSLGFQIIEAQSSPHNYVMVRQ